MVLISVSYEYLLNDWSSLGGIVTLIGSGPNPYDFAISTFYRVYAGKRVANGFFADGGFSVWDANNAYFDVGIGPGFGFGGKFLIKDRWVAEINIRLAMHILDTEYLDFVGEGGISLGRRF